jgi:hypothetical protein
VNCDLKRAKQVDEHGGNQCLFGEQPAIDFQFNNPYLNGMNSITNLSAKQLRRAANIKDKIQSLENKLNHILGSPEKTVAAVAPRKKRKMSAAGRAKIAAAQKARWAKAKGPKAKQSQPKKRKMSAAARARISAATKARWAKAKGAGKKTL